MNAPHNPNVILSNSGDRGSGVRAGSNLLNELGGSTDVTREAHEYVIRGHGCPLSEAVAACPETCGAVEETELCAAPPVTEVRKRHGFVVQRHEADLYGVCGKCA